MSQTIRAKIKMVSGTCDVSGSYSPYVPATMRDKNGDPGHPAEGGTFEDIRAILVIPDPLDFDRKISVDVTELIDSVHATEVLEELLLEQLETEQDAEEAAREDHYEDEIERRR